ncbi:MAG: Gfo/Idh/MocA family protein [Desulfonatronovibrionaceae bacterium]
MQKLDFGVIGVGHLGRYHVQLAAEIPEINLVGAFDLNHEQASGICSSCGTKAFSSLEDLLDRVDAVSIVVPTSQHCQVGLKCLEHNCHLFIEKPITSTVKEAEQLIARADQAKRIIQVGHIERFNPAVLAAAKYEIRPMFIEAHRLSRFNPRGLDVSVVLDLMIHDLDLILYLVKSRVNSIDACGVSVVSEAEDIANVRLKFQSGCVANLTSSRISLNPMRRMRLFQKNQYIALDFMEKKADIFQLKEPGYQAAPGSSGMTVSRIGVGDQARDVVYEKPEAPDVNALQMELEEFAGAVLNGREPEVPGAQGRQALEVANAILAQIASPDPV